LERSDLVLVTGGLGPTVDDRTRDAAALATGCSLTVNETCLADIEAIFVRWGRKLHDNNRRQAFLPAGAIPVPNPVGTAPGFIVEWPRKERPPALLICLPGVPREMKHLMEQTVEPFLGARLGPDRVYLRSRTLRTVGIGESLIDNRIADLMARSNPTVGLAAHTGQVDVRVTARAVTPERADAMVADVVNDLCARLGEFVYGEGTASLESVVVQALRQHDIHLALVETNTGGHLAQRLREAADDPAYLAAARTVSTLSELGPRPPDAPVSAAAAEWAAAAALAQAQAVTPTTTAALAVCGETDPAVGPYGVRRGETFVAVAAAGEVQSQRLDVGGVDNMAQAWAGNGALNFLRRWLLAKDAHA